MGWGERTRASVGRRREGEGEGKGEGERKGEKECVLERRGGAVGREDPSICWKAALHSRRVPSMHTNATGVVLACVQGYLAHKKLPPARTLQ